MITISLIKRCFVLFKKRNVSCQSQIHINKVFTWKHQQLCLWQSRAYLPWLPWVKHQIFNFWTFKFIPYHKFQPKLISHLLIISRTKKGIYLYQVLNFDIYICNYSQKEKKEKKAILLSEMSYHNSQYQQFKILDLTTLHFLRNLSMSPIS